MCKLKMIECGQERMEASRPYYDLRAVREAILTGHAFVAQRKKNLETLDVLGFTPADALGEVLSLGLNNFKGIAWEKGRAADEYLKRIQGIEIYIKFFMENGLVVLSFHK